MMKRKLNIEDDYDEELSDILVCKYCEFTTNNIDELDNHISSSHEIDEEFEELILVNDNDLPLPPKKKTKQSVPKSPELHKCPHCEYSTKRKHDLPKHLIKHSVPGTTTLYRCSQCTYQTKRKSDMPKHMLAHCTNVQMFQCPECPYKTKRKNDLPKHMLCHKSLEDVPLFRCDYCEHVTKRKGDMAKHILNHEAVESLTLFDCSECDYRTKRKNDLHKHMLVHCDRHVSGVFKCLKCTYATDKTHKFSKHVLSDCKVCEDSISLEHLMLEDIIATVEGDKLGFIEADDDDEDEYTDDIQYLDLDENECEEEREDDHNEYTEHTTEYNRYRVPSLEEYHNEARKKHGVFSINLGQFSVDSGPNPPSDEEQPYSLK